MTAFPYAEDGVQQGDFTEQFRYPIVHTSHPRWSYVTAVVVTSDEWMGPDQSMRPTDDELRIVASFHEQYCSYWYGPAGYAYRATMERKHPFDIDGSANTRILIKRGDGDWAYRQKTWSTGPTFVPALYMGQTQLDLLPLLDHIHGGYHDAISPRWLDWKATHRELFAAVTS